MHVDGIKDFHRARMLLLAREGADILACETVTAYLCSPELHAMNSPSPHRTDHLEL